MKENISKEDLLLMVKRLDLSLDAHLNRVMGGQDLSGGQAAVLCYLLRHHPEGSCIRDLCLELGVSHATLSLMIKKLQEKGVPFCAGRRGRPEEEKAHRYRKNCFGRPEAF